MATEIITQLEGALNNTISLLSSIDENDFNKVPFEGSWTAAQVGRHLYKSQKGTDSMLQHPMPEPDRDPGERIPDYKNILMDFEHKLESPGFLVPEDKEYNKAQLISALKEVKQEILPAIENVNLNETAPLEGETPLKGSTKLEIIHFLAYHTIRHNHQIEKIKATLA